MCQSAAAVASLPLKTAEAQVRQYIVVLEDQCPALILVLQRAPRAVLPLNWLVVASDVGIGRADAGGFTTAATFTKFDGLENLA